MDKNTLEFLKKALVALIIPFILSALYTTSLSQLKPTRVINLKILDMLFLASSSARHIPLEGKDIALVAIDDESLREMNMRWPWSRAVLADIVNRISLSEPAAICIDLVFIGKSEPNDDLKLIKAIRDAKNVISASYFGKDGRYVVPEESISRDLMAFGFVNKPKDPDSTVRRMRPLALSTEGKIVDYSLSLKAAGVILNKKPQDLTGVIPLLKNKTTYIQFYGKEDDYTVIPAWKVLKGHADLSALKGRIVFIGMTSVIFHDIYPTPLGQMPGVIININEALTYRAGIYFKYADRAFNFAILYILVLAAVIASFLLPAIFGLVLAALEITGFLFFSLSMFTRNVILDLAGVVLLVSISSLSLYGYRYVRLVLENMALRREASTDGLTGLFIYRYFEVHLKNEFKKAIEKNKELSLIIFDVDHFKKINDTYGHEFGNRALKAIAKAMREHSRENAIISRYGGDEFIIILPGIKRNGALVYAERLRSAIKSLKVRTDKGEGVGIAISIGIASIRDAVSDDYVDFIKIADIALYSSKTLGRDRISVFDKKMDNVV